MYGTEKVAPAAADLAHRATFSLGTTHIVPSTREIIGPDGNAIVQPRVMHVLLALADARGTVVTRDALAERCWGGRFVAEDSLNAAIGELRKALRTVSAEGVGIETVPKTGYRLTGIEVAELASASPPSASASPDSGQNRFSRRGLVAGGVVALAGVGAAGWLAVNSGDGEAALLIERGSQALRQGLPDASAQSVRFVSKAVELEPGNAKGWGMLALAWRSAADFGGPDETAKARTSAEMAAKRALAIDPRQSDALTALATLTPSIGNWVEAERRIRAVLAIDPDNSFAVAALGTLFMSTGQVRKCLERLDWMFDREPLSPNMQFRRVYTLWSVGRLAEMDRAADNALQSWPRHPAVWFARFYTLAFTGRAAAAQAMFGDGAARPPMPPSTMQVLQMSLNAIASNREADIENAIAANAAAAHQGPSHAVTAIMMLSHFGASDAALDVARGFLTRHGPVVVQLRHTPAQPSVTDMHHRMTMMLWVPVTQALRLHPDFRSLCDGLGMVAYWRATATRPDFNKASLAAI